MELPKMKGLFGRSRALEVEIDHFHDKLSQSAVIFKTALAAYLKAGATDSFIERQEHLNALETEGDKLRRSIETKLYAETLIPESRGDVLGLLEASDEVHGALQGALWGFAIELPDIPEEFREEFMELGDMAVMTVESLVLASRAFFRNIEAVLDHNHKVEFYETEADKISSKLKISIFRSDLDLARKLHLRTFVERIDEIADKAEDVADHLNIYAIKRSI